jgi:tetratricopeptide (TPR) repeat protein
MPDLRAVLENSLRPRFEILRELGGGGMSRVFLAREVELDRTVVIKVLPPEIAGLNLARFRRETQTAAKLHHPHIVPLHASGDAGGVLYYTMPFVEGETLRGRMAQRAKMPVDEVVRILRDIADALAYAHQQNVVHRDIKPENVLLSSGHALVTDFGIAKALSVLGSQSSVLGGHGLAENRKLTAENHVENHATASGLAVGTPAYMAPEQAVGDPNTDHRADLYALGLLGYEMLAGKSPFDECKTPQELLVAHIADTPRAIEEIREDTPALLATLIMRCLEKSPDNRPPSAAVVREQLDAMRTPSGGAIRASSRPRRIGAIGGMAVMLPVIAAMLVWTKGDARPLDREVVAVVPFRVNGAASLGYLREGMLDLFAAKLTGEGGPRAADPRAVLRAWKGKAGSDTADLSREDALSVAEELGVGQLLLGDVSGTADSLVITARLLDVQDGRLRANGQVTGPADSLAFLIDAITGQLLTIRAGEGARLSSLTSTSLPALRNYLAGQWLYRRGRYRAAGEEHNKALTQDSTFALAAIALMQASSWYGFQGYYRAADLAWRYRAKLTTRDRALLTAQLGPNYPKPSSLTEEIAAAARYRDIAPDRADSWFHYGDVLMHFGWLTGNVAAHAQAETVLRQAVTLDSTYSPALEHLVLLTARRGDTAATRRFTEMFLDADSASESAMGVRWRLAAAVGDFKTADSIAALPEKPGSSQSIVAWIALEDGIRVPQSYEVVKRIAEREVREGQEGVYVMLHDAAMMVGRPAEALAFLRKHESTSGPLPRERIKDALVAEGSIEEADSAAASLRAQWAKPMPASPKELGNWVGTQCLLPLWMTVAHGDTSMARSSVIRLRVVGRDTLPISQPAHICAMILDAAYAVKSRAPDARTRVARADSAMRSGPQSFIQEFGNTVVARLLEEQGDPAGALSAIRRRYYFLARKPGLGAQLRIEGRLAAAVGDHETAIKAYRHYLALRENAEPAVARESQAIRTELERLERIGGGQ